MKNRRLGEHTFNAVNLLLMIAVTFVCVYPFYYVIIYSVSEPVNAFGKVFLLPYGFNLTTYSQLFKSETIYFSAIISVLRTCIGTVVTLFCSGLFAFVFIHNMPLKHVLYRLLVITMYFNAGLIPWYLTMRTLHLNNNFLLYILPSAVNAFYVVIMKTFYESIPLSLEESAMLDGAGYLQVYMRIIVPVSKPITATVAVFAAVTQWNSWMDTYFLVTDPRLKTLQVTLYEFLRDASQWSRMSSSQLSSALGQAPPPITADSVKAAITVIVTLPILFVYPFLQKHLTKGLMLGAIKG